MKNSSDSIVKNLDNYIADLFQCKYLSEEAVKALCEKVAISVFSFY